LKIGVVIVSHYRLGEEMLQAARLIVPDAPRFFAVGIEPKQRVDEMRATIAAALDAADQGHGVLVLTDMFGGTPSNMAISVMEATGAEVIAGVNLPMLIRLASVRKDRPLVEAVDLAKEAGRKYISVASQVLSGTT
jgi:mannose PTS system EIIA component